MKVLIVHNSLNPCGGAERVSLHTIKALMEAGHDVALGTVEKTNWAKVFGVMGIRLPSIPKEYFLVFRQMKSFSIYQRTLAVLHVMRFSIKKEFDLMINTHGDVMLLPTDITYLHFPALALLAKEPWRQHVKYTQSLLWRAYFEPYHIMQRCFAVSVSKKSLVLTNSNFSKEVIKKYMGCNAIVVYPPVEVHDYLKLAENVDRDDAIMVISRFSEEKNLHLIPFIARELPGVEFHVAGSVSGYKSRVYYEEIQRLIKKFDLKNVHLHPNVAHQVKLELLSKSKVFLHLMPYEHFGIAVVEGMASGCVPVVHKSGGQWIDIVKKGEYGFGFQELRPREIAEEIEKALNRWSPRFSRQLSHRATIFSDENFRRRILNIAERYFSAA